MTYAYITERCSCNAKLTIPVLSTSHTDVWENALTILEKWRSAHIHEAQPGEEYGEPPTVVESGSSHERAADEFFVEDRAPIGFARNAIH